MVAAVYLSSAIAALGAFRVETSAATIATIGKPRENFLEVSLARSLSLSLSVSSRFIRFRVNYSGRIAPPRSSRLCTRNISRSSAHGNESNELVNESEIGLEAYVLYC